VGEAQLSKGDTVRFGDVEFVFDGAELAPVSQKLPMKSASEHDRSTFSRKVGLTPTKASIVAVVFAVFILGLSLLLRSNRDNTLDLARATVLVMVRDGDDEICGFGSGFLVRDSQTVATNHHVIASIVENIPSELECKRLSIGVSDESGLRVERFLAAEVLESDAKTDVALLRILNREDEERSEIPIASGEPRLGDAIRIFGYPAIGGGSLTVTDGYLGGVDESESDALYKTTSQIATGNSGGPVVDRKGRVVGLAAARYVDSGEVEAIGLIIPVRYLVDLLDRG
jgi:S1-C subfamily serine protease